MKLFACNTVLFIFFFMQKGIFFIGIHQKNSVLKRYKSPFIDLFIKKEFSYF
ncbi:hypothetical protein RCH33_1494 [Flavobacterium daejeonense]|nr:hypothetical protein RCH33_1494 [Flavobacterium daejeonense]